MQLLRLIFVWYLNRFPDINILFGSLTLVVLFLVSLFLFWMLVILGAEASYVTQNFHALKLEHDNPAVLDTSGWVHYRAGHDADAVELLAQAVRGAPYRASYRFHLGMAYARQRRRAEARLALLEAIRLDPDADFAHEARQTLAKLGS